jgi:hypothetical protein
MPIRRLILALAVLSLLGAMPVSAQQKGIAFVIARELSMGMCIADTPAQGFACAIKQCTADQKADEEACEPHAWCSPAGWSVDLFVQSKAGPHFHEYLCGWPSRDAALRAARLKCETSSDVFAGCFPVAVYDPNGIASEVP